MPVALKEIKDLEVGDRTHDGDTVVEIHSTTDGKWHMVRFDHITRPSLFDDHGGGLPIEVPDPPHPAVQALDEYDALLEGIGFVLVADRGIRHRLTKIREKYGV